jgi:tellurite resistance protein
LTTKSRSKKNNRVSASSLTSLLSANPEDRRERKERKRTEKLMRHEQALQELHTAERRRAYFRDVSHRQELVFGPEVRAFSHIPSRSSNLPLYAQNFPGMGC